MPLSSLHPDSCYWCAVYSDECYWLQGSGNKVSGSIATQSTTRVDDFILLPIILDEWESNVRKCVVYLCVLSQESYSWIALIRAKGKMSHRVILRRE